MVYIFWSRVYINSSLEFSVIQMSYVIVENDPLDETTQFTVCEVKNSNVTTSGGCSEILQIQTAFELIEISPDCVEYMGKLMCGEIVEATVLSFKDESSPDNTDEFARTLKRGTSVGVRGLSVDGLPSNDKQNNILTKMPDHNQPITTLESTEKCMPIICNSKPSNTSLYIRVLRNIYETHIHICQCIAVCSCCSTA